MPLGEEIPVERGHQRNRDFTV